MSSNTVEVIKSELDLFSKISFQKSIESSDLIQYRPTNALSEGNAIEFQIPSSPNEYTDLQNCYLHIKGKLVKQDGSDYAAGDDGRCSLISYPLFTIWDQISVFVGSTLISQASNTQAYSAYFESTLDSTPDKISTFMHSAGYVSPYGKTDYNCDKVDSAHAAYFDKSKTFTFYGRFHGSIFNSDKLLIDRCDLRIILNRGSNAFICMGSAAVTTSTAKDATKPKLILHDVVMYVRKCRVANSIALAHDRVLQTSRALYPIKRSLIKVINLSSGQNVFFIDNLHSGQMPLKLILGITTNTAFAGSYTLNPFKFSHHNLNYLVVNMNNIIYPKIPYQPNYDDDNYQREYYDFFLNIGATRNIDQPAISYKYYKECQALYAFNFNADFETNDTSDWISVPKLGFLSIQLKFKSNLTEALKLICYLVFDNLIEIDNQRNVLINY